jgi:hypothetical protein
MMLGNSVEMAVLRPVYSSGTGFAPTAEAASAPLYNGANAMKTTLSIMFTGLIVAAVTGCTANVENPSVDQTGKDNTCVKTCDEDKVTCTGKCTDDICKASCAKTHDDCAASCVSTNSK